MIDWLKVRFDFKPPSETAGRLYGGEVMIIEPDGVVKWRKVKPLEFRGSHESSLYVSIDGFTGCLLVDGNPTKYFQGHNVFGTWDLRGLAVSTFGKVVEALDLPYSPADLADVEAGSFEILRVDLTESFACGSLQRARSVLESLALNGHLRQSRHGKGLLDQGTLYYRKHSRRWAAKVYCKGQELGAHRIFTTFPQAIEVHEVGQDLLRLEFVIRAMELKTRGLHRGSSWSYTTPEEIFASMREKLEIPMSHELPSVTLAALPTGIRLTYSAWKNGEDVRLMMSKPTFYKHRRVLRALGVDISVRQPKEVSNVVPLVQLITLRPLGVPAQFIGTEAYFEPRRIA